MPGLCCLRNSSIPRVMLSFGQNCRLQNAFQFANAHSYHPPERWFIPCFIRLDVFHPVLGTALQKNLQAYFPRSAWGNPQTGTWILRSIPHHGFRLWETRLGLLFHFPVPFPRLQPSMSPADPQPPDRRAILRATSAPQRVRHPCHLQLKWWGPTWSFAGCTELGSSHSGHRK